MEASLEAARNSQDSAVTLAFSGPRVIQALRLRPVGPGVWHEAHNNLEMTGDLLGLRPGTSWDVTAKRAKLAGPTLYATSHPPL